MIDRPSGRVILIGPGNRSLLFRGGDPGRPQDGTWWFTPGGGVDVGESPFDAARRELWEETGQSNVEWGGRVATREAIFEFMGATYRSHEDFYVAYTTDLAIRPAAMTELEIESIHEHRWMETSSLIGLPDPVYPAELVDVLDQLGERMIPGSPWRWLG